MNDSRYSILRLLCGERNRVDSAVELGWRRDELFRVKGGKEDEGLLGNVGLSFVFFSSTSTSSTKSSE